MARILAQLTVLVALGIFFGGPAAASQPQTTEADRSNSACSQVGFHPGSVQFDDCVGILKRTMMTMRADMMKNMSQRACLAAGIPARTEQLDQCVANLKASLSQEAGYPG